MTYAIGDRVAYSRAFLQSTVQHTGAAPFRRGRIVALNPLSSVTLAEVMWADGMIGNVNVANLVRADRLHLEPQ